MRRETVSGSAPTTVLAFDFGLRRIGVAVGDTLTRTAMPRPAITDLQGIEREIRTLSPGALVVGCPGSGSSLAPAAARFAAHLEGQFKLPVHRVNEQFSSLEAQAALRMRRADGTRRRRVRKEDIDSVAAAIILERWFAGEERGSHG